MKKFLHELREKANKDHEHRNVQIDRDRLNRRFVKIDDVRIALDSWIPDADLCYISHAHMDHIPYIPKRDQEKLKQNKLQIKFLCSKITREIAHARTNGYFSFPKNNWLIGKELAKNDTIDYKGLKLTLINNGHTYGSVSLFIEGNEKIFYTSDFITETKVLPENRGAIEGLKPKKCDRLIMECTFGAPKYIFPSFNDIQNELNNYIYEQISTKHPIILLAYSFGKSQFVLNLLNNSHKIILHRKIAKLTEILEKNGIEFSTWEPYGNYNKNILKDLSDYILIIPPFSRFLEPYKSLISNNAKLVSLSGKVLNNSYCKEFLADNYIPYSDHCDFKKLFQFVKGCNAEKIYLEHGKIEEFSYYLLKNYENIDIRNLEYPN